MYNLLFENKTTIITNIMVLTVIAYIVSAFIFRKKIDFWGWLILGLAFYGLVVCCFAAARDGLNLTIQNKFDGSCNPGIFELFSIQNIIGSVCALLIIISGIIALFIKKPNVREILFFVMSSAVLIKIVTVEVSRIMLKI